MALILDVKVGDTILIQDKFLTKITIEDKSGRRARMSIDTDKSVKVKVSNEKARVNKMISSGLTMRR